MFLRVRRLSADAIAPKRASPHAAGYDLSSPREVSVPARGRCLVPLDIAIAIPEGHYGRIAPRSGLALKHGIDVGAGVIDSDYRGNVGVLLFNFGEQDYDIRPGDRIAQLIIEQISTPDVVEVDELDSTERGDGGFGHTGMRGDVESSNMCRELVEESNQ